MSSAVKILPYYTYEEYCKWEGDGKYISADLQPETPFTFTMGDGYSITVMLNNIWN